MTCGFKTREGGVGILQITGTIVGIRNDDGGLIIPTIRYKLLKSGATTPTTTAETGKALFGLQAERMITTRDANRDGVVAFRFENNLPFMPPENVTGHFRQHETRGFTAELKQWMKGEKVDLLLQLGVKEYDVLSLDLRDGFAGQPTEWETISPDRAAPLLAKMEMLNSNPGPQIAGGTGYRDGSCGVQVCRTRDGTVGYYQLRGFSDPEGHGVVIRCKLVQGTEANTAR